MILVVGIPSEPPVQCVIDSLQDQQVEFVVLNQRQFDDVDLSYSVDEGGRVDGLLRIGRRRWPLHEITGVYARMMDDRQLPELKGQPEGSPLRLSCRSFHERLSSWLDIAEATVINRGCAMSSNSSKPFQAQIITAHGLATPETLITNDPTKAIEFIDSHGEVIFKSISGVRSIVQTVTTEDRERLEHIRMCPVQFQVRVPGTDVRVHVIGSEVFATEIQSIAIDYRYSVRQTDTIPEMRAITLSEHVRQQCVSLTQSLGLEFSGIDLLIGDDGTVTCFEANPSPAFSYFEAFTKQPIAAAIAQHLTRSVLTSAARAS
jgi:RimK-like ATP-grasp domain